MRCWLARTLWAANANYKLMNDNSNKKIERSKHADTIIQNHVIWSMGAGLVPILMADILAVSALQIDMIRQLCRVYDVNFSETQGKAIVTSLTSSTLARAGARSLVKLIPGIGSLIGGVTVSAFAGASTYALGEVFKRHFESGGTILDFDMSRLKNLYKEKFEKGKKVAEELRKKREDMGDTPLEKEDIPTFADGSAIKNPEQRLRALKDLAELKEKALISQEEYERLKKEILNFGA